MRILFVTDHLGYAGGAWHGCTTYFVNVLPELRRAGHQVSLYVLRGAHPAAARLRAEGVDVGFHAARRASPLTFFDLARCVLRDRIAVLHATQRESMCAARTLKLFLPTTKVVTHVVDSAPVPDLEIHLNRWLPQPDATLCVSSAMRATAINVYGTAESRVHVLHNGLDLERLKPSMPDARTRLRCQWGVEPSATVVVSTSRFAPEKRLDLFIRLIPQVLQLAPRTVFVFAGDGPGLDACRVLAASVGVSSSVRFLGFRHDIPDVLAASDVAVMLCLREAFGYSAAEAMAMGVPVAAYDAAGLSELITHDRTGLLAPQSNDDAFATNLARLVIDQDLRKRLGDSARDDVQRFGIANHAKALVRLYTDLALTSHAHLKGKAA
jgi:glycosyltransferase involved in cell wall biosynthesis